MKEIKIILMTFLSKIATIEQYKLLMSVGLGS